MLRALLLLPLLLSSATSQQCVTGSEPTCQSEEAALLQARHAQVLKPGHSTAESKFPLKTFAGVSMYFILVDRFARDDGNTTPCANNEEQNNVWCGGTLKGITQRLDYIAELGFDCIWLTPIVAQYPGTTPSGTGAMGYWAQDIYKIDEHFGTPDDYHELIQKAHEKGLCIVQDFVANHMGPIHSAKDVEQMNPFNKTEHFHQLDKGDLTFDEYVAKTSDWPPPAQAMWSQSGAQCTQGQSCMCYKDDGNGQMVYDTESPCNPEVTLSDFCKPGDYGCKGYNEKVTQEGWFYDLGDLNQTNPYVKDQQLKWIKWYVDTYKIDAFRLDTAAFMAFDFLSELQAAAGIPIIGEVTATNLTFHATFQANPPPAGQPVLDGVLNFPTYFTAQAAFCNTWFPFSQGNLDFLGKRMMEQVESGVYKSVDSLGNFADNHDVQRVTDSCQGDLSKATNFVVWSMLAQGVPIVYYGTEEFFTWQREAFWAYGYNTSTYMFGVLKTLNGLRKEKGLAVSEMQVKIGQLELTKLVFTRGGDDGVWVYLNNMDQTDQPVSYCGSVPPPLGGGLTWVDAISGEPADISNECYTATDSLPKVLVARQSPTSAPEVAAATAQPTQPPPEATTAQPTQPAPEAPAAQPAQPAPEAPAAQPTQAAPEAPTAQPAQPAPEAPAAQPAQPAPAAQPTQAAPEAPTAQPAQPAPEAPAAQPAQPAPEAPAAQPTQAAPETPKAQPAQPEPEAPEAKAPKHSAKASPSPPHKASALEQVVEK